MLCVSLPVPAGSALLPYKGSAEKKKRRRYSMFFWVTGASLFLSRILKKALERAG
jgi:hypothetical protein